MARTENDDDSTDPTAPSLARLADLMRARRGELPHPDQPNRLGIGQRIAAAAGRVSPVTWNNIEQGRPSARGSYAGVEDALGWARGSIVEWLENGGPEPAPAPPVPTPTDDRAWVRDALRHARHRELLEELEVRLLHLEPSTPLVEQRRHLAASSGETETVESVEARGDRAGLPLDEAADGGGDVARGGQA